MNIFIPFNRPYTTGAELEYIAELHKSGALEGDGPFTALCNAWLEKSSGSPRALLTHSCTAALEMASLLLDIEPGDEVIMPSFTFVSTANAFVLRGAVPVFVDVREDTLNLDERLIEAAITPRTRAIVPVHYAGVSCEMDTILDIAQRNGLQVVEDAAQGLMSSYKGRPLGSMGDFGAYSFHATKNIVAGEGGALLVNDPSATQRAEIIREKGTDRSRFFRGEVDKYSWQDVGSSYLPSELVAAFLWAQLERADSITTSRMDLWRGYDELMQPLEARGLLRRPVIPDDCDHNAHMYYVLLRPDVDRDDLLRTMREAGIGAVIHYVPLHTSAAGQRFGRVSESLSVTESQSERLVRLPLWVGLTQSQQELITQALESAILDRVSGE